MKNKTNTLIAKVYYWVEIAQALITLIIVMGIQARVVYDNYLDNQVEVIVEKGYEPLETIFLPTWDKSLVVLSYKIQPFTEIIYVLKGGLSEYMGL
jgi:hypothetical protein